jgi:hypothetical protein
MICKYYLPLSQIAKLIDTRFKKKKKIKIKKSKKSKRHIKTPITTLPVLLERFNDDQSGSYE